MERILLPRNIGTPQKAAVLLLKMQLPQFFVEEYLIAFDERRICMCIKDKKSEYFGRQQLSSSTILLFARLQVFKITISAIVSDTDEIRLSMSYHLLDGCNRTIITQNVPSGRFTSPNFPYEQLDMHNQSGSSSSKRILIVFRSFNSERGRISFYRTNGSRLALQLMTMSVHEFLRFRFFEGLQANRPQYGHRRYDLSYFTGKMHDDGAIDAPLRLGGRHHQYGFSKRLQYFHKNFVCLFLDHRLVFERFVHAHRSRMPDDRTGCGTF
ncbi:unnamed protein product [Cylicostephanus goldi]|uniref:CUB domain-containing protein n=1 Tax=Cylicostephanus goldi TaxID=71465 RepID=A0A3P7MFD4_CYLGO|nr:unnamed protein product [Cylicostephanus goldi]